MLSRTLRALRVIAVAAALGTTATVPSVASAEDGGAPTADQLLSRVQQNCDQVSHGTYRASQTHDRVAVCATGGVYVFSSSMAVDCDGRRTATCNEKADSDFRPDTSLHQSDGQPLDAAHLPYVVLPKPSGVWDYRAAGIRLGDVVAVVYDGRVDYAVVGDIGPASQIGEASYATASDLGINPDPHRGGADSGVTYIVFPHTRPDRVEDHGQAVAKGSEAATALAGSAQ